MPRHMPCPCQSSPRWSSPVHQALKQVALAHLHLQISKCLWVQKELRKHLAPERHAKAQRIFTPQEMPPMYSCYQLLPLEKGREPQGSMIAFFSVKRIAKRKAATTAPRPVGSPQCSGVIPGRAFLSRQTLREGHDNLDDCALRLHEDTPVPDSRAVDLRLQSRLPCVNRLLVSQRQNEEDER